MDVIRIRGGTGLKGDIQISGAKNAALPIFAATLLTEEECIIENVPDLSDLRFMAGILRYLGGRAEQVESGCWSLTAQSVTSKAPYDLVRKMRASICLLGPLVGRLKRAEVSQPGGCVIGPRPIELHLKGLEKLGCKVAFENGYVKVDGRAMRGADVFLGGRFGSSALGTANILMAATLARGTTHIESAACEPEVVDLCHMLTKMGARIDGIGSHHLTIEGVSRLRGCTYRIIPDRIEAGTMIMAGAISGGDLRVRGINPRHSRALFDKMEEAGVHCSVEGEDCVRVRGDGSRRAVDVVTLPHPGFPTDLQAQMCALMSITPGLSIVTERVFPHRFMHVSELQRMGADISIEGPSAIINGRMELSGAPVMASDLRASAALILAGLAANKETWVQRVYHLDRGYDRIDGKLQSVGADITRMPAKQMPKNLGNEF